MTQQCKNPVRKNCKLLQGENSLRMSSFEVWMNLSQLKKLSSVLVQIWLHHKYSAERGQIVVSGAVNLAECLFAFTLATLRIVSINCFAVSRDSSSSIWMYAVADVAGPTDRWHTLCCCQIKSKTRLFVALIRANFTNWAFDYCCMRYVKSNNVFASTFT